MEDNYNFKHGGKKFHTNSSKIDKINKVAEVVQVNLGFDNESVSSNAEKCISFANKRKISGTSIGSSFENNVEDQEKVNQGEPNKNERGKHPMKIVNK